MLLAQEFHLKDVDWFIKVFYIVDTVPIDYVLSELIGLGCSNEDLNDAEKVLNNTNNSGLTYTNNDIRQSIIVIGYTTCPAEFQNTLDHEKLHLALHIAKYINMDIFSEDFAYLFGNIGFQMFPIAKKFLCEHCRKELD